MVVIVSKVFILCVCCSCSTRVEYTSCSTVHAINAMQIWQISTYMSGSLLYLSLYTVLTHVCSLLPFIVLLCFVHHQKQCCANCQSHSKFICYIQYCFFLFQVFFQNLFVATNSCFFLNRRFSYVLNKRRVEMLIMYSALKCFNKDTVLNAVLYIPLFKMVPC